MDKSNEQPPPFYPSNSLCKQQGNEDEQTEEEEEDAQHNLEGPQKNQKLLAPAFLFGLQVALLSNEVALFLLKVGIAAAIPSGCACAYPVLLRRNLHIETLMHLRSFSSYG